MLDGQDVQDVDHACEDGGGGIGVEKVSPPYAAGPQRIAAYPKPLPNITDLARAAPWDFCWQDGDFRVRHDETIADRERVMKRTLMTAGWIVFAVTNTQTTALADTGWGQYGGDQGG